MQKRKILCNSWKSSAIGTWNKWAFVDHASRPFSRKNLQYGDRFYILNPYISFEDIVNFENWVFPAKKFQTEISQSQRKLIILGNAKLKFFK